MEKKTITQNNLPNFWNKIQALINDRLPKGALAAKDVASIENGGTDATTAKEARVNLGITYGTEIPTEAPATGSGAIYFFEDDATPVSIPEGGTGAKTAEGALENFGVADYIIEQGIDGIWTWRKWASGIAECWGSEIASVAITGAWGSLYYGEAPATNFPTGLFTEVISIDKDVRSIAGYSCWYGSYSSQEYSITNTGVTTLLRPSSAAAYNYRISYQVKGTWK